MPNCTRTKEVHFAAVPCLRYKKGALQWQQAVANWLPRLQQLLQSCQQEEAELKTQAVTRDKAICTSTQPLGRIIIGLYGRLLPQTVSNFLALIKSGAYSGTTFSRVIPGEYVQAGRQGSPRMGLVQPPTDLPPNKELLASRSFRLEHSRPGTVSLSISENDDDPILKQRPSYRPTEFLITTGPGPVPSLDGQNVVFGTVLEGYNTVTAIASQPTFKPNERIQAVNQLASFIGDERAARVRAKYGKPLKSVVITDVGVLPIREPFPRPV
ncbi:probable peptidyl-prolyl cis-trans isomerase B [Coccomyxa sp. Obi]|nr:probable peptidyl-prolyl cis-trans isomerase B [Coccomyxa sp. Obi]